MKKINNELLIGIIPLSILIIGLMVVIGQKGDETERTYPSNTSMEEIIDIGGVIEVEGQVLAVLPDRCRSCGRCAMIDPEHFRLDGRTATVISQESLDSNALVNAISSCHDGAIVIN